MSSMVDMAVTVDTAAMAVVDVATMDVVEDVGAAVVSESHF